MQALGNLIGVQRRRRHGIVRLLRPARSAHTRPRRLSALSSLMCGGARAGAGAHPMATMSQSRASAMKCCTNASSGCGGNHSVSASARHFTAPRPGMRRGKRAEQLAGCMAQQRMRVRQVAPHRRVAEVEGADEDAQLARQGLHADVEKCVGRRQRAQQRRLARAAGAASSAARWEAVGKWSREGRTWAHFLAPPGRVAAACCAHPRLGA